MNPCRAIDLGELSHLRADGPEAVEFLQGQLSNDVRLVDETHAQISSYNSPKGRMLAVLHLLHAHDHLLIELHRSLSDSILKRLRMFVLRAKVALSDDSDVTRAVGLVGDTADEALQALSLPVPEMPLHCLRDDHSGLIVTRRLGQAPRFSITGPAAAIAAMRKLPAWNRLTPASFDHWRCADIEAGVPVVYPATSDHFVPQMANLDLHGGISFDKGCYTGQEIVARLHYLGQLKRRMVTCRLDGPPPAPGTSVVACDPPTAIGEIVDAVEAAGGSLATAVMQTVHLTDADLRLPEGTRMHILTAPEDPQPA